MFVYVQCERLAAKPSALWGQITLKVEVIGTSSSTRLRRLKIESREGKSNFGEKNLNFHNLRRKYTRKKSQIVQEIKVVKLRKKKVRYSLTLKSLIYKQKNSHIKK